MFSVALFVPLIFPFIGWFTWPSAQTSVVDTTQSTDSQLESALILLQDEWCPMAAGSGVRAYGRVLPLQGQRCDVPEKCKLISVEKQDAIPYGQAGQFAIFFPQLFGPASTRPMSKRAHGSAVSENQIERRKFRINPNAQRSSADVEIRSKISDPNRGQLHGTATFWKAGKNELKAEKDESD